MMDGIVPERRRRLQRVWALLGPFLGLIAVVGFFALLDPVILNPSNLRTVPTQTVIVGLGAIGMTFVIIGGGIDLSVGSLIALSSVVTAWLVRAGVGPAPAALAGIATGSLCGCINGLLITSLRVVPFIVTLGMLGIARGLAKAIGAEQKIDAPRTWLVQCMSKSKDAAFCGLPAGVWLMFGFAGLMALLLRSTKFGVHTYAIGSNEATARLCGVPVARTKVWHYTISGFFAGLAGVMMFSRLTVGDPTTAAGKELEIIAAVVIGGASLSGGEGTILGALIGAFLMAFLANGCNLVQVPNSLQEILIGVTIVAAVALDRLRHRR